MSDKARNDRIRKSSSGKSAWVPPVVEIAQAKSAEAFGGPPGGVDYGIYS
jgi:hypothetical protein